MATKVTRELKEINEEVAKLDNGLRASAKETSTLNKSLRLDPTNTALLGAKMDSLGTSLTQATKKVKLLKTQQVEMKKAVAAGTATDEEYKKLSIEIGKAEAKAKSLRVQLKKTNKVSLDKIQAGAAKVGRAATIAVGAIVALETAYAVIGDTISKASDKYNISAKEFQKGSYIFSQVTGDTEGYSAALKEMQSRLGQVEKGSSKTIKAFEDVGISIDELSGKSSAEAIELYVAALKGITDVDERAAKANGLLTTTGTNVALIAGLTADEISELNVELSEQGILSQTQADNAAVLSDHMADLKLAFTKVGAELAEAMIPLMEALLQVARSLTPVISGLASAFKALGGPIQAIIAFLLVGLAIFPKLIAGIKAVNVAFTLLGLNPIGSKIILIAAAVAALILLLIELAKWLKTVFGKKYSLDVDASIPAVDVAAVAGVSGGTTTAGSTTATTTNYYDYSTQNNTVNSDLDIDKVAAQLSTKIRVGG